MLFHLRQAVCCAGLLLASVTANGQPSPARLASPRLSETGFAFVALATTGALHDIHFSEDLRKWRLLATLPATNAVSSVVDAAAADRPRTFYRAASQPGPRREPFHAFTWNAVPVDCSNLTTFIWFYKTSQPAQVATQSVARPEGHRALFTWDMHRGLLSHSNDVCLTPGGLPTTNAGVWPSNGVATARALFDTFFRGFRDAGGQIDWLLVDYEDGYSNWQLGGLSASNRWLAIQGDPRFPALAQRLGFTNLLTVADWRSGRNYLKWNALMAGVVAEALHAAVFEPARQYFPKLRCSNYGSVLMEQSNAVPDLNGHWQWSQGIPTGTHQAPSCYAGIGQLSGVRLDGMNSYGQSPFAGLLLEVNAVRGLRRSSRVPVQPWVAWQRYAGDGSNSPPAVIGGTPYYRELVFHLGLLGNDGFLFWNPHPWLPTQDPQSFSLPEDERLLDGILGELADQLAPASGACVSLEPLPWDARVVATGNQVDGRVVWRVTFAPGVEQWPARLDGQPVVLRPEPGGVGTWFTHAVGQRLILADPSPLLLSTNAAWKYWDRNGPLDASWVELSHDDTSWPDGPGPFGYGDANGAYPRTTNSYGSDPANKFITTYYRHRFTLAENWTYTNLAVHLQRDDGAVIYLNGAEVFRSNMPTGAVNHLTLATNPVSGSAETAWHSTNVTLSALVPGTNVFAAEVHQNVKDSSDIFFNLRLTGQVVGPSAGPAPGPAGKPD